jgi:RNA polymerase sigma factor (sigma-70 family)
MRTDAALLQLYAETRSEEAFAELVRRHLDGVYSTALRRVGGDTHLAEDVCQQVFVALARKAGALVRHPALTSWLFVTTRNEAANVVRTERRRKTREHEALAMEHLQSIAASPADWSRLSPVLDAVIDDLREVDRTAVLLRFVERRGFAEIGMALNVSEDAARMRVERALDRMRALLSIRGISSTSTALSLALAHHAVVAAPASLAAQVIGSAGAVATASGVWTTFAGVVEFMSVAKLVGGVVALLAIVTGFGLATHKLDARRSAEAALAVATERHTAARAKLRETEARLAAIEDTAAQLQQSVEEARKRAVAVQPEKAPSAAVTNPVEAPASDPRLAGDAFMTRHPDVKRAVNEYARARIDFRFAELYSKLGLTAAQVEQFRELMSAGFGMGASGPKGESMSLTSGDWEAIPGRNAKLREMLGPQGMKAFEEYALWVEPARNFAAQIAGALWYTDAPLTPGQADQLAAIMNENRKVPARGLGGIDRFDWDAISAKAATILSGPQLAAVEGQRARDRFNSAMNRPAPVAPSTRPALLNQPAK